MLRLIPSMPFYNTPDDNGDGSGVEPLTANSLEKMLSEDDDSSNDDEDLDLDPKPLCSLPSTASQA